MTVILGRDNSKPIVYVVTNRHGVVLFVTRDKAKAMKSEERGNLATAHELED